MSFDSAFMESLCCFYSLLLIAIKTFSSVLSPTVKLHIACASGYREVVSLLLVNRADPHPADNNFWTPLHLAAKYGQVTRLTAQQCQNVLKNVTLIKCNPHVILSCCIKHV